MKAIDIRPAETGLGARVTRLPAVQTDAVALAAWHGLTWLLVSCGIGLLLATLLLVPSLNGWLGEWTYGRWMPLHMNLNLYGWCSLPLVAWLFRVYQADQLPASKWSRAALWAWSTALMVGAGSWLTGHTSGKLFLDWQGYALKLFALVQLFLWLVLAWSFRCHGRSGEAGSKSRRAAKTAGLAVLLFVPVALVWAARPQVYPPVNPDTGGPTGASLLESTLGIVLILLLLPLGFGRKRHFTPWMPAVAWGLFAVDNLLCLALGRGNNSHHQPSQFLGLASLLLWVPVIAGYFNSYDWPAHTRLWRHACLGWWSLLVVSGWIFFLPGLLDRFKFTDALVGHAHLAMAGFVSSLDVFVLAVLLGDKGHVFRKITPFLAWHVGTLGYFVLMLVAGWREGTDPAFTMVPGAGRNAIYTLRLACGGMMTMAALQWWMELSRVIAGKTTRQIEPSSPGREPASWAETKIP